MFRQPLLITALICGLPLSAGAWEHSHERGVDLYQAGSSELMVSLVCDPNSVYGTTNSGVLLEVGANPDLSGPVELIFPDGNRVKAELDHGRFGKAEADEAAWQTTLDGLRAHQSMTVSIDGEIIGVELGEPMPFTCT
ncbi:hypothetical protein [Paracoccus sp. 228]|uniref:hypothetical protein n=1 Tax=Paracoccus sp. 228 TaxID=1192054 RepID=UPI0005DF5FA2|nr:hypothetical protein [Paracoccus sp. 228]KIX16144.1 hypothetical protein SY26_19610 [Paracoccus sp. 228]